MIKGTVIRVPGGEDRAADYCLETARDGEHGRGQRLSGCCSDGFNVLRSKTSSVFDLTL